MGKVDLHEKVSVYIVVSKDSPILDRNGYLGGPHCAFTAACRLAIDICGDDDVRSRIHGV